MPRRSTLIRTLAAGFMALSLGSAWAQGAPVLRLVGDNWCPYNCDPRQGQNGYLIDLLAKALEGRYQVDYALMPWTRALQAVDRGDRDVLIATTPGTTPGLLMSQALGIDRTCFFVLSTSQWQYRKLADLKQQRIGVIQDYKYDNNGPIDLLISRFRKTRDPLLELSQGDDALGTNFRKLLAGRMDVVLENELVGAYTVQAMRLTTAIKSAGCDQNQIGTVHVAMSAKSPYAQAVLSQIDTGVRQLRDSGVLAQILQTYGMRDWYPLLPAGR